MAKIDFTEANGFPRSRSIHHEATHSPPNEILHAANVLYFLCNVAAVKKDNYRRLGLFGVLGVHEICG
jgi:hypothetical protein